MSPEQASGAPVDHRSDLCSLGVVGFYTVTGRVPFEDAFVLAKHVTEPAPPVASVAPHVPTPERSTAAFAWWLRFLSGRRGHWLFKLGRIGLRTPDVIGGGTYVAKSTQLAEEEGRGS